MPHEHGESGKDEGAGMLAPVLLPAKANGGRINL